MAKHWFSWGLFAAVAVCTPGQVGCGGPEASEARTEQTIIGGTETLDRREVGRLFFGHGGRCTATLVRSDLILTAAHCVDYLTQEHDQEIGSFMVQTAQWDAEWHRIDRYASFSSSVGLYDVALVRLAQPVDPSVATPTRISRSFPETGETLVSYGYGCTARNGPSAGTAKRRVGYSNGQATQVLCYGDSGGPTFRGEQGPVVFVTSGFAASGHDVRAWVPLLRSQIETTIADWDATYGAPANATPVFEPEVPEPEAPEPEASAPEPEAPASGSEAPAPEPEAPAPEPEAPAACLGGDSTASASALPSMVQGAVCAGRDSWFELDLTAVSASEVQVRFEHDDGDIDVELFDGAGVLMDASRSTTDLESVQISSNASTIRVRVFGYNGADNSVVVTLL